MATAPHELVGTSRSSGASHVTTEAGVDAPTHARAPSALPADYRTAWPKKTAARFVSSHAMGRYDADLFASEPGAPAVGARLVEEHFERGTSKPGPIYMMEKREPGYDATQGDWRYVVVGPDGNLVTDGKAPLCAGCHAEAPRDQVFGVGDGARAAP